MICPEFRQYQPGLELVDSYVFNPHKWLLTNVDCSVLYVADRAPLLATIASFLLPSWCRGRSATSSTIETGMLHWGDGSLAEAVVGPEGLRSKGLRR